MILKSSQCIVLEVYLLTKVLLYPAVLRTISFRDIAGQSTTQLPPIKTP
jgi:hypothetical protein